MYAIALLNIGEVKRSTNILDTVLMRGIDSSSRKLAYIYIQHLAKRGAWDKVLYISNRLLQIDPMEAQWFHMKQFAGDKLRGIESTDFETPISTSLPRPNFSNPSSTFSIENRPYSSADTINLEMEELSPRPVVEYNTGGFGQPSENTTWLGHQDRDRVTDAMTTLLNPNATASDIDFHKFSHDLRGVFGSVSAVMATIINILGILLIARTWYFTWWLVGVFSLVVLTVFISGRLFGKHARGFDAVIMAGIWGGFGFTLGMQIIHLFAQAGLQLDTVGSAWLLWIITPLSFFIGGTWHLSLFHERKKVV